MKRGHDDSWEEVENKVQKLDVEVVLHGHLPHICWMADNWFQARFLLGTVCKSWYQLMKSTAFPVQDMNTRLIEKLIDTAKEGQSWMFGPPKEWPITLCIQVVVALKRLELVNVRPTLACFSKYEIEKRTDVIFQRLNLRVHKPHYKPEAISQPICKLDGTEFYTDTSIFAVQELAHFKLPKLHFNVIETHLCNGCNEVKEPLDSNIHIQRFERAKTEKDVKVFKMDLRFGIKKTNRKRYEFTSYTSIIPTELDNTTKTIIGINDRMCTECCRYGFNISCLITPMMTQSQINVELYDLDFLVVWQLFVFAHRLPSPRALRLPNLEQNIFELMEQVCKQYGVEKRFTHQGNEINFFCN